MLIATTAILLALRAAAPDTLPAGPGDAYLDAGARTLVQEARTRRESAEGTIRRYRTTVRSSVTLRLNTPLRDRLVYRCDAAVRVDWRRGEPAVMEVLGGREVTGLFSREESPEPGDCAGSIFDPTDDRLSLALGGMVGHDSAFVRHPLAAGSEAHYRFRTGDTTRIRLPGGRVIRLVELRVQPRRSEPQLVSGSLWLDADTRALVRAVLRMARPYDFARDADPEDREDYPPFLPTPRVDMRYLVVEYGLWHGRWWLPRLVAIEGEAQAGELASFPLRAEKVYEGFEVESYASAGEVPPLPPDSLLKCSETVRVHVGPGGGVERAATVPGDSAAPAAPGPGKRVRPGCRCTGRRCARYTRIVPEDEKELLASPLLPPSSFSSQSVLSESELREIAEQVRRSVPVPWELGGSAVSWDVSALDVLRYNRVEGLSVGVRAEASLGRVGADATARLGVADLRPGIELGAHASRPVGRFRAAAYQRLDAMGLEDGSLALGNSLRALVLGRDEGNYFRAGGVELTRRPLGGMEGVSWRLFAERQRGASKRTDFSLARAWGDDGFRDNPLADAADQLGADLALRLARGLDPAGWRGGATLLLGAQTGSYRFLTPALELRGTAPLPGAAVGTLEVAAGSSRGTVPVQSLWYLGGPSTVRGYAGGTASGEAFWRTRAEVATAAPGARLVLFSDAGWTGARAGFRTAPTLLSTGVGVSFLDGLLRLDLARALRGRTGWRLDLHLDGAL